MGAAIDAKETLNIGKITSRNPTQNILNTVWISEINAFVNCYVEVAKAMEEIFASGSAAFNNLNISALESTRT